MGKKGAKGVDGHRHPYQQRALEGFSVYKLGYSETHELRAIIAELVNLFGAGIVYGLSNV